MLRYVEARVLSNQALFLQLDTLGFPISLAGVDLLPGLLDGAQDSLVWEGGIGDNNSGLGVEGDVVGFDTWGMRQLKWVLGERLRIGETRDAPSSLPSTRFTAPEQPPQVMLTLNLYVCSDMVDVG